MSRSAFSVFFFCLWIGTQRRGISVFLYLSFGPRGQSSPACSLLPQLRISTLFRGKNLRLGFHDILRVRGPLGYLKNIDKIVCSYVYEHLSGEKFYPLTRLSGLLVIQRGIRTEYTPTQRREDKRGHRKHDNPQTISSFSWNSPPPLKSRFSSSRCL